MIGLSEKQINDMFTEFYNEFDSIPFCELNLSDAKRTFDGYNFIVKGDLFENIIGPFRYIQPLSFSYMSKGKFFYGVEKSNIPVMGDVAAREFWETQPLKVGIWKNLLFPILSEF